MNKIASSTCGLAGLPKNYRTSSKKYAEDKVERPDRIIYLIEVVGGAVPLEHRGIVVQSEGKRNALLLIHIPI
jgi:hypothetical protein